MGTIANIFWLGTKEIRSFLRDFVSARAGRSMRSRSPSSRSRRSNSQELHNASIAFVDEDQSELSRRIVHAFLPPYFQTPQPIAERDIVPLDERRQDTLSSSTFRRISNATFSAAASPPIQVNVDATAMVQAGLGADYAEQIILTEMRDFVAHRGDAVVAGQLNVRIAFNPNVTTAWFTSVMGIINNVTHAGDHSRRRRDRARARARHHGSSSGDAVDAVRDRHVQGLGQRPGDHDRRRPFALCRRSQPCSAFRSPGRFRLFMLGLRSIFSSPAPSAYFSAP